MRKPIISHFSILERSSLTVVFAYLGVEKYFFSWLYWKDSLRDDKKWDEREDEWYAANGHRLDSNPGPLQRGQSCRTWDAHSTNWATGAAAVRLIPSSPCGQCIAKGNLVIIFWAIFLLIASNINFPLFVILFLCPSLYVDRPTLSTPNTHPHFSLTYYNIKNVHIPQVRHSAANSIRRTFMAFLLHAPTHWH